MANQTTEPPVKRRSWRRKLLISAGALLLLVVISYFVATSAAFFKGVVLRSGRCVQYRQRQQDASCDEGFHPTSARRAAMKNRFGGDLVERGLLHLEVGAAFVERGDDDEDDSGSKHQPSEECKVLIVAELMRGACSQDPTTTTSGDRDRPLCPTAAAPVWVSDDLNVARERVRWFPALVSNHVVDLVSRYKPEELPSALTSYIRNRGQYDYLHHCEVESDNAKFVSDEVTDRFCLVGPTEAHIEKLRALAQVGVTQFNLYLMCGEEEDTIETYRRKILPALERVAKA